MLKKKDKCSKLVQLFKSSARQKVQVKANIFERLVIEVYGTNDLPVHGMTVLKSTDRQLMK